MIYYPALIRKEADTDFGVEFPDFPGCVTAASTVESALTMGEEALRFHVEGLIEDGEAIPEPTPLDTVLERAEKHGATVFLVRLLSPKGRAVRVNITLDKNLLADIDAAARQQGTTRSGYLAMAARAALDPFVARLMVAIPKGGRALDGIKRLISEEEKKRLRDNPPPDIGKIGVSDFEHARNIPNSKGRRPVS